MNDVNPETTTTTQNLSELFAALAMARQEFGALTKSKSANITSDRGRSYSYSYADLNDLIEATAAALAKHGLVIIQEPEVVVENGRQIVIINGCIAHKSGSVYHLRPLPLPVAGNTAQAVGSAISYARRYQMSAVLNLAAADDDGSEASNGTDATRNGHPASVPPTQNGTTPNGKAAASTPYYRHAWNHLTGKPYDLVKWTATLHSKSDKRCTVRQYGYLVSLVDDLSNGEHGYVLSVLCQAEIDKNNRPGLKMVDALFEILPTTLKDENNQSVENPNHRADIAELIREIAAQGQAHAEPA